MANDLTGPKFTEGGLNKARTSVSVLLTAWTADQRRFVERLVEHRLHGPITSGEQP